MVHWSGIKLGSARSSRAEKARARKMLPCTLFLAAIAASSAGFTDSAGAQGYGYTKAADPLIQGVKSAIAAAREGKPEKIRSSLETLQPFFEEIEKGLGVVLTPSIDQARESGNARNLAFALAELVYHQLRWKLQGNLQEELQFPPRSRRRLETAQYFYEEILSFTVRRSDSKKERTDHEQIVQDFKALRGTIGSEGLFGVGAKDPDLEEFRRLSSSLVTRLRGIFPQFAEPRPGELGAAPPKEAGVKEPAPETPNGSGR